jgi:hypothetical protein
VTRLIQRYIPSLPCGEFERTQTKADSVSGMQCLKFIHRQCNKARLIVGSYRAPLKIRRTGEGRCPAVLFKGALSLLRKGVYFFNWIPAFAGMTKFEFIEMPYSLGHDGAYRGFVYRLTTAWARCPPNYTASTRKPM